MHLRNRWRNGFMFFLFYLHWSSIHTDVGRFVCLFHSLFSAYEPYRAKSILIDLSIWRQGPARRCGPVPHIHFWAVSHISGISGNFGLIHHFFRHGPNFQRNCLKFNRKIAENCVKVAYFLKCSRMMAQKRNAGPRQKLIY